MATVVLKNGQMVDIWYTAWKSIRHIVAEVIQVSTDLPKHEL
jgi:hypothetical protein